MEWYVQLGIASTLVTVGIISFMVLSDFVGFGESQFKVDGRTVLLTGGSEGLGLELGKQLSAKGANIVIVARNKQRLFDASKQIASSAKSPGKQRFHYISADVTSAEENIRIVREVTEWNDGFAPDIVWANAGSSVPALFLDTSIETFRAQMDINYFAAVYLAHATFRLWLAGDASTRKMPKIPTVLPNHFIITSSVAAFIGLPGYTPYAPAKAALRNLHDGLRSELDLYNFGKHGPDAVDNERPPIVKIHTIFPGTILSPGLERENKTKHGVTEMLEADDPQMTPAQVAKVTIRELEKGKHMISVNWLGTIIRAAGSMISVRDGGIIDALMSSGMQLATPFVNWDLEGKVKRFAKDKGYPQHRR